MQAQAYRITEDRRLESVPPERVGDDWKTGDFSYWIDLQGSGREALEHYFGGIEVNEISVQIIKDPVHIALVISTEDAIFLPLTLLAGIYGMNFQNMPELKLTDAYPALLGLMGVIAIGMWRYFKRNGWLD